MKGDLEKRLRKLKKDNIVLLRCEFPLCFASEDAGRFIFHHWDVVGYVARNERSKERIELRSDYQYGRIPPGSSIPTKPFVIRYSDVTEVEVLKKHG